MAEKTKTKEPEAPEPNIVLTARDKDKNVDISRAVERINTGASRTIKLPPREEQLDPFYHEDAEAIIAAMPHLYKDFKGKKK